jgi:hypothetical protein
LVHPSQDGKSQVHTRLPEGQQQQQQQKQKHAGAMQLRRLQRLLGRVFKGLCKCVYLELYGSGPRLPPSLN